MTDKRLTSFVGIQVDPKSQSQVNKLTSDLAKLDARFKSVTENLNKSLKELRTLSGDDRLQAARQLGQQQRAIRVEMERSIGELASVFGSEKARRQFAAQAQQIIDPVLNTFKKVGVPKLQDYIDNEFLKAGLKSRRLSNITAAGRSGTIEGAQLQRRELELVRKALIQRGRDARDVFPEASASSRTRAEALGMRIQSLDNSIRAMQKSQTEQIKVQRQAERRATEMQRKTQNLVPPSQQARNNAVQATLASDERRRVQGGAGLFRSQATLLRNYAVLGAGVGGVVGSAQFVVDFDRGLRQLQSILALTNSEMGDFRDRLIEVSERTKFTAQEVVEASIVLGQAGFGRDEIGRAIEGVTFFATAVGSTLKEAVDLATSTLGVFNKDASQMNDIVDKMTTAINTSKLNLDKLALGLQFSGNLAAQSNISFEETVSALAAMANSGIRSGSTLGTGLRQILTTLRSPTDKLKKRVEALGLQMSDLDITTYGLIPTLKNLAMNGFTVADAMQTMELRAASAYGAFINNIDAADELNEKLRLGGAASRANDVQMRALGNQMDRVGSIAKTIVFEAFEPLLEMLTSLTTATADFLSSLRSLQPVLSTIAPILAGAGIGAAGAGIFRLGRGLLQGSRGLSRGTDAAFLKRQQKGLDSAVSSGLITATAAASIGDMIGKAFSDTAEKQTTKKLKSGRMLSSLTSIVLGLIRGPVVIGALVGAGALLISASNRRSRRLDELDNATGQASSQQARVDRLNRNLSKLSQEIDKVFSRRGALDGNDPRAAVALNNEIIRLNDEFRNMGLFIDPTTASFQDLVKALTDAESSLRTFTRTAQENNIPLLQNQVRAAQRAGSGRSTGFLNSQDELQNLLNSGAVNSGGTSRRGSGARGLSRQLRIFQNVLGSFDRIEQLAAGFSSIELGNGNGTGQLQNISDEYRQMIAQINSLVFDPARFEEFIVDLERLSRDDPEFNTKMVNFRETYTQELSRIVDGLERRLVTVGKTLEGEQQIADANDPNIKRLEDVASGIQETVVRDVLLGNLFNVQNQIKELTSEESLRGDSVGAFNELLSLREAQADFVTNLVTRLREALEDLGFDGLEINRILTSSGFTNVQGQLQGLFPGAIETLVGPAKANFNQRTQVEDNRLGTEIQELMTVLRDSNDPNVNDRLITEIESRVTRRGEIERQRRLFAAAESTNGVDSESARIIGEQIAARVESEIGNANEIALMAENRGSIISRLRSGQGLDPGEADRLLFDRELRQAIVAFVTEASKEIQNTRDTTNIRGQGLLNDAERLRGQAGLLRSQADLENNTPEERIRLLEDALRLNQGADELEAAGLKLLEEASQQAITSFNDLESMINRLAQQAGFLSSSGLIGEAAAETLQGRAVDESGRLQSTQDRQVDTALTNNRRNLSDTQALDQASLFRSAFGGDRRLAIRGALDQSTFTNADGTPNQSFANGQGGGTISNMFNFLGDSFRNLYEGFDPLVEVTMGLEDVFSNLGNETADALTNIVTGADSAGSALRSLAASFLESITRVFAQTATNSAANYLSTAFAAGASGGGAWTGREIYAGQYNTGGMITSGLPTRDSTYAKVAKGEWVLRRKAVQALGTDTLRALNNADLNQAALNAKDNINPMVDRPSERSGSNEVNVWVVTPDQKPESMGAKDVLVVVQDDIQRNGPTRKLIKQISMETR